MRWELLVFFLKIIFDQLFECKFICLNILVDSACGYRSENLGANSRTIHKKSGSTALIKSRLLFLKERVLQWLRFQLNIENIALLYDSVTVHRSIDCTSVLVPSECILKNIIYLFILFFGLTLTLCLFILFFFNNSSRKNLIKLVSKLFNIIV